MLVVVPQALTERSCAICSSRSSRSFWQPQDQEVAGRRVLLAKNGKRCNGLLQKLPCVSPVEQSQGAQATSHASACSGNSLEQSGPGHSGTSSNNKRWLQIPTDTGGF